MRSIPLGQAPDAAWLRVPAGGADGLRRGVCCTSVTFVSCKGLTPSGSDRGILGVVLAGKERQCLERTRDRRATRAIAARSRWPAAVGRGCRLAISSVASAAQCRLRLHISEQSQSILGFSLSQECALHYTLCMLG